jgi:putative oxidoreductase
VILSALHVPLPHLAAWTTTLLEPVGGIALMAGLFVPLLTLLLTAILLTATMTVHLQYGFSSVRLMGMTLAGATFGPTGYELDLLYLAALLAVALGGPTPLSLDSWRHARWRRPRK